MIEIFNALAADSLDKISRSKEHVKATVEFVKKAENINSFTAYTWIIKGFYEFRQGDIRRAEDHFKNAARQHDQQCTFAAHVGLGITSFFRQKYALALENFTRAITHHPGCNSTLRIAFSICAFKLEQYERARAAAEKAMLMDSKSAKALVMLALIEIVSAQKGAVSRKEKHRNAFDYCILALQLDSTCSQALNIIANHYFHTWQAIGDGIYRSSSKQLIVSGAAQFTVHDNDPLLVDGKFPCKAKEVRTINQDDILIILDVELPGQFREKKFSVETKAYSQVRSLAQKALENSDIAKVQADSLYFLGRLCHAQGNYSAALEYYGRVLQLVPDMALASFGSGQILLALGRFSEAERMFRAVLVMNSEDKDTQSYLLLLNSFLNKELVAFDKIREVSAGFPYEVDLWLIQAHLRYMNSIELPISLRMMEMAITLMEKQGSAVCMEICLNISVIYYLVGSKDKALLFSQRALLQLPSTSYTKSRSWNFKCDENSIFYEWSEKFSAIFCQSENLYVIQDRNSQHLVSEDVLQGVELCVDDSFMLTLSRLSDGGFKFNGYASITVPDGKVVTCKRKVLRLTFSEEFICYLFNHARILEGIGSDRAAEELYLAIINSHPTFIDCYLRLGQLNVKKGCFEAACNWLIRGLNIDGDDIDLNVTLGDFYMSKSKWIEAKASYEKANGRSEITQDSRAMVSLGNMYIANLGSKRDENLKLSYKFYHHVLNKDNLNIFAAVGLGMVCSEKKLYEVARDIFSRVQSCNFCTMQ